MTEEHPTATIGQRIQHLRHERGLTQRALAEPAYTAAYVSTLEAGRAKPSDAALRHIAERLGVTYDELTTGRPAQLAAELKLALADAQGVLATGDIGDAARRFTDVLNRAEQADLTDIRPAAHLGLGECALEAGRLADAARHFETAEAQLADQPLPRRAAAVRGRAVTHLLAGELRYACYLLESTIDQLNATGLHDPDALLLLYSAVIGPYMDMGAHARAAQAAELALALAPGATDPALVAHLHRSVARTLIAEGRTAEADASLAKAQELYQHLRLACDLAKCHWMRGYVHAQAGDLTGAERELRTARQMLATRQAELFTHQVDVELADVLRRLGRHRDAEHLLTALLDRTGPDLGAVHAAGAHRLLGLLAEEQEGTGTAEEHYVRALSLLERAGAAGDLADLCRLLGDLYRRTGRTELALDVYRTGLGHRAAPGTTTLGPAPAAPPYPAGRAGGSVHR
ncbi:helix-turn-helix domain-containing protein [Kitasatospora paracochleata]|uniref:Tetratricopeptide (TPR) repeat protein n=1 Tax=Kitasatospora paracochleata TaxID=58354 RepID=A0ABT1J8S9_9ACTN|nr:helix-turn-helix transcriptional regulator [Kitasatospora paracochleata]MCP2313845.1 tetratricopeptide (TPR) repeat protein [Kitasatospora paracochleata]